MSKLNGPVVLLQKIIGPLSKEKFKESIETLILNTTCEGLIICNECPFALHSCTNVDKYARACEYYEKEYGEEELFLLLLRRDNK